MRRPCDENKLKSKLRFLFLTNPLMIYKTTDGQILTRDAVQILICCIYEINDAFYFEYQIQCNHLDAYLEKYMNHIELYTALKYLQEIGYVENLSGNKDDFSFNLTISCSFIHIFFFFYEHNSISNFCCAHDFFVFFLGIPFFHPITSLSDFPHKAHILLRFQ